jgi:tRNA A37 methylthiotransferase MiaB
MKNIFIKTYGCSLNRYYSGLLSDYLATRNYNVLEQQFGSDKKLFRNVAELAFVRRADFIVFNTCNLSGYAEKDIIFKNIQDIKKINPKAIIIIGGCGASNKNSILGKIEGTLSFTNFDDLLQYFRGRKSAVKLNHNLADTAIILLKENCGNSCSYCSCLAKAKIDKCSSFIEIRNELNKAKDNDCKRIEFGGACYGDWQDPAEPDLKFADLLALAAKNFEIINLELHPKDVTAEVIKTLRNNLTKIHELSVPIQHCSDLILQKMKRGYNKEYIKILLAKLFALPGLQITTDIIVGFPGETAKDWQEVIDLSNEFNFTRIDVYYYSDRVNSLASNLKSKIAEAAKRARALELKNCSESYINLTTL